MPRYTTHFDLTLDDIALIEDALLKAQSDAASSTTDADPRQVSELLGRLHNQKVFYRPKTDTYVGG